MDADKIVGSKAILEAMVAVERDLFTRNQLNFQYPVSGILFEREYLVANPHTSLVGLTPKGLAFYEKLLETVAEEFRM